jgi:hypothetical protein
VHGFSASLLASCDNFLNHEIGLRRGGRAYRHLFVSHFNMKGARIGFGIDGNSGNPHLAGGLDHAACNFATIGNQNLLEH